MNRIISCLLLVCIIQLNGFTQNTIGILQNEVSSQNGYTLFSNSKKTFLINNCGEKVHQWESQFRPGAAVYLMPDGNLLRTNRILGEFNAGGVGGGLEILDKNSNLLWSYRIADEFQHSHHDVSVMPNGNILVIVWDLITPLESIQFGRKQIAEIWSEKIVEIEPVGIDEANIVWEWKLKDHLIQDHDSSAMNYGQISDHPERIDFNYLGDGAAPDGDWAHLNGISYHEPSDQIVVSSRHFGEIWIIDHSTTTSEASSSEGGNFNKGGDILYRFGNPFAYKRGSQSDQLFVGPHSPTWTSEKSLMVFNNVYTTENSSVERWTLPLDQNNQYIIENNSSFGPIEVDWRYTENDFSSKIMSSAQELANGNILICEAIDGRFFEVTMEKETVWEYINPVRTNDMIFEQGTIPLQTETFHVTRYLANDPILQDYDLMSEGPIEFSPTPNNCTITSAEFDKHKSIPIVKLHGNPTSQILNFTSSTSKLRYNIISLDGRLLLSTSNMENNNSVDVSRYPSGVYFLQVFTLHGIQTIKWLKL